MSKLWIVGIVLIMTIALAVSVGADRSGQGGRGDGPIVYVMSQGLFFDSIVTADPLPQRGRFQKLEMGGPTGGLITEFGPGQPGYLGGRWWQDVNEDGKMDEGDHFFLCPLLPPGREEP